MRMHLYGMHVHVCMNVHSSIDPRSYCRTILENNIRNIGKREEGDTLDFLLFSNILNTSSQHLILN